MNNPWNKFISDIFGSFWERLFVDSRIMTGVRTVHHSSMMGLDASKEAIYAGMRIDHPDYCYPKCACVYVPSSECTYNMGTIGMFEMSGIILKRSIEKTLTIPAVYVDGCVSIQNSATNPSIVWVPGINMHREGDSVVLHITSDSDIMSDVITTDDRELIQVYKLYVVSDAHDPDYNSTFGVISGDDYNDLRSCDRKVMWSMLVDGPTVAGVNALFSSSCGNDICTADDIVAETWQEGPHWHISTVYGHLYSGDTAPCVMSGDTITDGDILFYGVNQWDKDNIPPAYKVPYIIVPSTYGNLTAYNQDKPVLSINGKLVPDMCNPMWAEAVSKADITITDRSVLNPLAYTLTNVYPSSGVIYSVDPSVVRNVKLVTAAKKYLTNTVTTSSISGLVTACEVATHNVGITGAGIKSSYAKSSDVCTVNPVCGTPMARYTASAFN